MVACGTAPAALNHRPVFTGVPLRFCPIALPGLILLASVTASRGQVSGRITLDGKPPEMKTIDMSGVPSCAQLHPDPITEETVIVSPQGELKNVVVSISNESNRLAGEAPKTPAVLDQQGCMYVPHVLAMMTGQDLVVKNSDPFLHNVHSLSTDNGFNMGQPNINDGQKVDPQPQTPEIFRVKCDIHPWMTAWIAVFDHPYFAVTADDGKFTFKSPPDGDYTLVAWQEKFGKLQQKINVKNGIAQADFIFKTSKDSKP